MRPTRGAFVDEATCVVGPGDVHLVCSPCTTRCRSGSPPEPCSARHLRHLEPVRRSGGGRRSAGEHGRSTHVHAPARWAAWWATRRKGPHFDRLRLLVHAGSPCPPALKRQALERWGRACSGVLRIDRGQFTCARPRSGCPTGHSRSDPVRRTLSWTMTGPSVPSPDFARFSYWRTRLRPPPPGGWILQRGGPRPDGR